MAQLLKVRTRHGFANVQCLVHWRVRIAHGQVHDSVRNIDVVVHLPAKLRHGHAFGRVKEKRLLVTGRVGKRGYLVHPVDDEVSGIGVGQISHGQLFDFAPNVFTEIQPLGNGVLVEIPVETTSIKTPGLTIAPA